MMQFKDAWLEHQRRRWMRPNAHLWICHDAWRFMPPGSPRYVGRDVVKYFWPESEANHATVEPCGPAEAHGAADSDVEFDAELLNLRREVAELRLDLDLRKLRAKARKYSPDQPRDDHGRWTREGAASSEQGTAGGASETTGQGTQIAARISPEREAECELQYRQDTFICNTIRTRSCWAQAAFRLSQCLSGGYIPPLYH